MSFLKEFLEFAKARKKYWLFPILIVLIAISVITVITEGTAVAPFIYSIF